MRNLLGKKSVCGLAIAALAVSAAGVLALAKTQSPSKSSHTTTHKSTAHKSTHPTSSSAGAHTATTPAAKSSSVKPTSGKSSKGKKSRTKKAKGQQAPTPDRISEIQEALASRGAFTGTPTGVWDDSTVDAVKKFQSANKLTPTGKLDALTLQKLGLGSETAGVAPPIVPPDAENRLRSSSAAPSSAEPR